MTRTELGRSVGRTRLCGAALACLGLLAACVPSHPYTAVYLANLDDEPYCVSFVDSQYGDRFDYPVGPRAAGGLYSAPGETPGVIELRRIGEPVIDQIPITGGRSNLVQIENGALNVDDDADLSSKPSGNFDELSGCAPVRPSPTVGMPSLPTG